MNVRSLLSIGVLALLGGCGTSAIGTTSTGGTCVATVTNAAGANNTLQSIQGGTASGDWSRSSGLTIVCVTTAQALEVKLTGASPNAGVTYGVSSDPNATGNVATVRYGETIKNANGSSGHVTWRGTAGTVKVDAAAKDTVTFSFSGVTAVVDPGSSQNLATGTMTLAGSGRVDDLLGFAP